MKTDIYYEIKDIDINKWNALLSISPYASYFQSPSYFTLLKTINGLVPYIILVAKENQYKLIIIGYIETFNQYFKRLTTRSVIESGILIVDDPDIKTYIDSALGLIKKLFNKKVLFVEIRNYFNYNSYKSLFLSNGWVFKDHYNILVNCSRDTNCLKNINSGKIRQVKKSFKNGTIINSNPTINQVRSFYDILQNLYINKIKKPLPDFSFFEAFYNSDSGKYFLIMFNEKVIGGIMCPIYESKIISEWYIGGLDADFKELYPSVMATYAPIQYANENNIQLFDFMGAGDPKKEYGVRDFKMKFGGDLINTGRFYYIPSSLNYKFVNFLLKVKTGQR